MTGTLRLARPGDAPAIRRIYAPHVEETAVSFETTLPTVDTIAEKVEHTLDQYPFVVFERDAVVGYAYAGPLREREAYQWTAELSVYVDADAQRQGIGGSLYEALLDLLTAQGFASAYGVVTLPNPQSVALHEDLGFEKVGHFEDVGYKHGTWHDVGWWQRQLPEPAVPEPPRPLGDIPDSRLDAILDR